MASGSTSELSGSKDSVDNKRTQPFYCVAPSIGFSDTVFSVSSRACPFRVLRAVCQQTFTLPHWNNES